MSEKHHFEIWVDGTDLCGRQSGERCVAKFEADVSTAEKYLSYAVDTYGMRHMVTLRQIEGHKPEGAHLRDLH